MCWWWWWVRRTSRDHCDRRTSGRWTWQLGSSSQRCSSSALPLHSHHSQPWLSLKSHLGHHPERRLWRQLAVICSSASVQAAPNTTPLVIQSAPARRGSAGSIRGCGNTRQPCWGLVGSRAEGASTPVYPQQTPHRFSTRHWSPMSRHCGLFTPVKVSNTRSNFKLAGA